MMYSFDTGATLAMITAVSDGYLALLDPLLIKTDTPTFGGRGPYVRTLGRLPANPFSVRYLDERRFELFGQLPALYVILGDGDVLGAKPDFLRWQIDVTVLVVSAWAGDTVQGRLAADVTHESEDPGIDTMLQHAVEYLSYQAIATNPPTDPEETPTLDSEPIHVTGWKHEATKANMTAWSIQTQVSLNQFVCRDRVAAAIDVIEANHAVNDKGVIVTQRRTF